jgi:uncharacterized protein (TIGR02145 family)
MKNTIITTIIIFFAGCTYHQTEIRVTDIDGHVYPTVTIGNKVWMATNLRVTHYRNGDAIPLATDPIYWSKNPGWCYYNNDTAHVDTYGLLYNWFAVDDNRNIAPEGWHIPTDEEITALTTALEKDPALADKLKANGLGGYRFYTGQTFHTRGFNGYWWGTNRSFEIFDWSPRLFSALADVQRNRYEASYGLAIRCVKNQQQLQQ